MMSYLVMALLSLAAIGFVAAPIMFAGRRESQDRQSINVALYKERVADLTVEAEDADSIEMEAQRVLLSDIADENASQQVSTDDRRPLIAAALLVPLFAFLIYLDAGFGQGSAKDVQLTDELMSHSGEDRQSFENIIDRLESRAEKQAENGQLNFYVARSYTSLGRYGDAIRVYERMAETFPDDPTLQGYYAEALFLAAERRMTLRLNPHDVTLLEIEGIAAITAGKPQDAVAWFQRALATGVTGQRAELLRSAISSIDPDAPSDDGRRLNIAVSAGQEVALPSNTTVFVYARAASGPPAPLAVQRLALAQLPQTVILNESMAMIQGMGLANFDEVVVIARISISGNVVPEAGDLEARSTVINMNEIPEVISLEIRDPVSL